MILLILYYWLWVLLAIVATIGAYRLTTKVAEAPLLDVALSAMTWIPWVVALATAGWMGLLACVIGQFLALQSFVLVHEAVAPRPCGSIRRTLDRFVGPVRNHLGLWLTIPALPIFLAIRVGELVFYPGLVLTLRFPKYRQAEWVNVSRQKFSGLVGHDLVWCLYCDWMTGVYSLGAEMLRSVESFWCPIRFYPGKKCENCRATFPDLDKWVAPDGTMKDVEKALEAHYSPEEGTSRAWWGHPERGGDPPKAEE